MMKDYYGKDASVLTEKKLWLLDLDGTVYNEDHVFDGVTEFLSSIKAEGGRYVFVTNNSSKSVSDYVSKVTRMGIKVSRENFFTSTEVAALYLNKNYPGKLVYCQGTESFVRELRELGIKVIGSQGDDTGDANGPVASGGTDAALIGPKSYLDAEVVLVGFDMELTMEKLRMTCEILTKKAVPYIATNPDMVCPVSFGFVPDCGSMCDMIRNATGKYPVFLGKPEPTILELVMEKLGSAKKESVLVGDRLYTDIKAGINAGITTCLVLSGESTVETLAASSDKADFVFDSVADIKL